MNTAVVVNGVLFLIGGFALSGLFPRRRMRTAGLWLLAISGVLKILVGLAPENGNASLHLLGAAKVPLGAATILLLSLTLRERPLLRALGIAVAVLSLVAAFLSIAAQTSGKAALTLGPGNGGLERLADYPAFVWMVAIGVAALMRFSAASVPLQAPVPSSR